MTRWTRTRTWPEDPSRDDWTVLRNGAPVGRAYRAPYIDGVPGWIWAVQTVPGSSGWADSLDAALEAIRSRAGY